MDVISSIAGLRNRLAAAGRVELIEQLLALGKEKGFLTYDDINRILPTDVTSSEEIDDVLVALTAQQIDVVDSEDAASSKDSDSDADSDKDTDSEEGGSEEAESKKEEQPDATVSPVRLEQMDDPVRMYLRQMGQISLLTREQELELAKRIAEKPVQLKGDGQIQFFWKRLLQNHSGWDQKGENG